MSGLLLRLAGPMQSWGERSKFDSRDTSGFPTRSGLLGMIACAQGRARGASLDDLAPLSFTIRIDRPGIRVIDYHTTGGGLSDGQKVPTADGKGRPQEKGTLQTWREYLSDATFVVAADGPDELLTEVHDVLAFPHWQPYLGRRSCPPEQPMLLGQVDDPHTELRTRVPLARRRPSTEDEIIVDFVRDTGPPEDIRSEILDIPTAFTRIDRAYRPRPVWIEPTPLSATLAVTTMRAYPEQLANYIKGGQ